MSDPADLPDVPDPALLDLRRPDAREALEAISADVTREAFDWLFGRAMERPIHPRPNNQSNASRVTSALMASSASLASGRRRSSNAGSGTSGRSAGSDTAAGY